MGESKDIHRFCTLRGISSSHCHIVQGSTVQINVCYTYTLLWKKKCCMYWKNGIMTWILLVLGLSEKIQQWSTFIFTFMYPLLMSTWSVYRALFSSPLNYTPILPEGRIQGPLMYISWKFQYSEFRNITEGLMCLIEQEEETLRITVRLGYVVL